MSNLLSNQKVRQPPKGLPHFLCSMYSAIALAEYVPESMHPGRAA